MGIFKVDVATIYNEKDHSFERKWAQLISPDSVDVSAGFLLLSIAVSERGLLTKVFLLFFDSIMTERERLSSLLKNILSDITQGDDDFTPS